MVRCEARGVPEDHDAAVGDPFKGAPGVFTIGPARAAAEPATTAPKAEAHSHTPTFIALPP